jgi:hypothetical protein
MNEIIVSDEYKRLKEEITALKALLAALTEEKNDLVYVECPKLSALYMEKIGDLVNQISAQELMIAELKYRILAVQAAINRAETVDEQKLDEDVKREYEEYQKRVDEQFEEAEKAKEEHRERERTRRENEDRYRNRTKTRQNAANDVPRLTLSEETPGDDIKNDEKEAGEEESSQKEFDGQTEDTPLEEDEFKDMSIQQKIKELYRRIVKKLHPDVNPDITEHEKELLNKANDAYRDGDLEVLEDIYEEICGEDEQDIPESEEGIAELKERIAKLKAKIAELRRDIDEIKASFPYTEKEFLENDEEVEKERAKYNRIIKEYEELINKLAERLKQLMKRLNKMEAGEETSTVDTINS